ncbi:hypothetical protein H4R26_000636 [Coemansia thaxteri]|uniref:Transcription elongation factor 1 homolog n=1 Tax=Coemansia thaxteri TaxID=2663907 RepID=A0A9W8BN85_9FUNG|nr:hypothetical protein H4R26_000636 [Coemansia thaxteri]
MGKRKSARKVVKKEQPKLDTTFDCLFCNHEKCISIGMDKNRKVGILRCKICSATYQAATNRLSEPIDVYSEWIDACEEAKQRETADLRASDTTAVGGGSRHAPAPAGQQARGSEYDDDDDEDALDSDGGRESPRGQQPQRRHNARDDYGVPAQLTDDSEVDDF